MKYIKGQTGNPNGRPKGSQNKTTADLRELLKRFVIDNYEQFLCVLKAVSPELRCTLWLKAMLHLLPKAEPEREEQQFGYALMLVDADGTEIEDLNDTDAD